MFPKRPDPVQSRPANYVNELSLQFSLPTPDIQSDPIFVPHFPNLDTLSAQATEERKKPEESKVPAIAPEVLVLTSHLFLSGTWQIHLFLKRVVTASRFQWQALATGIKSQLWPVRCAEKEK